MKKLIILLIVICASSFSYAQQCTLVYLADLDPTAEVGYQFAEGWKLQNTTTNCNAIDYYLTPQSAQYSTDGNTWYPYTQGMNLSFHRTSGPNQSNTLQSDRFSILAFQTENVEVSFNVSPSDFNQYYRVFFDIHDNNDMYLPPLGGGLLYTEFYYPEPFANLISENPSSSLNVVNAGTSLTASCRVRNIGYLATPISTLKVWLSSNTTLGLSDVELGATGVGILDPTEHEDKNITITIPSNTSPGIYYLIFKADALNQITELSESDNISYKSIAIVSGGTYDDITTENSTVTPSEVFDGDQITMMTDHTYVGNGNSSYSCEVGFYLSTDCSKDASDIYFGSEPSSIGSGDPFDPETELQTINTYVPGNYYILFVGDDANDVNEDNESNNVSCVPFTILESIDFAISTESVSATSVDAGGSVNVSCVQSYSGNGGQNYSVYVGYYLSTNQIFDASDIYLDEDHSSLGLTSSVSFESETVTIPANTPEGQYYILFVADHEDDYQETNEINNLKSVPLTVTTTCSSPVANFVVNTNEILVGDYLQVIDLSTNPTNWTWIFEDAFPSSSSSPNPPLITFTEPGHKDIVLTVSNDCGSSSHTATIKVKPDTNNAIPVDYSTTSNSSEICDPVDAATGAYLYSVEDMSISGLNGEFMWRRYYNSQLNYYGSLGWNWTHSFDIGLELNNSEWTVRHENGQRTYFTGYNDGSTLALYQGTLDTLYFDSGLDTYFFERPDGRVYAFDIGGKIISLTNRYGNTITFSYAVGKLSMITVPGGRTFSLSYQNGLIDTVTDNMGRMVSYTYDTDDNLASDVNVRNFSTSYTYDINHQMLTVTDPLLNIMVSNSYDGNGRIIQQFNALNNQYLFAYDTPGAGEVTMTNPLGGTQIHKHNNHDRLTHFTNEMGHHISFGYDGPTGRIKSINNENNNTTFFSIDDFGNIDLIQDPEGHQTTFTYNSQNLPLTITNALNEVTSITYNIDGNPTSMTLPNGGAISATYNAQGQIATQTNPNGHTTTYAYNSFGDLITFGTPTGDYTFSHDNAGRITSVIDRNGKQTSFTLDAAGNILTITDAQNNTASMVYDGNTNMTSYTDKLINTTVFTYDDRNQLIQVTNPLNFSTSYEYDDLGRLTKVTDANNLPTNFTYDARGQLIQISDYLGAYSYTYDPAGNLIEYEDALLNEYLMEYDDNNRLLSIEDPLTNETDFSYDDLNRIIKVTDALNRETHYGYNVQGQIDSITDPMGGLVSYAYDLQGNMTSFIDANGHSTSYTYNILNLPISRTFPGNLQSAYTYDNEGNLLTATDENGLTSTYSYNDVYDVSNIAFSNGANYTFAYDAENRLLSMGNTNGTTSMTRDARGLITEVTDPFGYITQYQYDAAGNKNITTYPSGYQAFTFYTVRNLPALVGTPSFGNFTTYNYDPNGSLYAIANHNGTSTNITRDALSRISTHTNLTSTNDTISHQALTYDAVGNIIHMQMKSLVQPDFTPTNISLMHSNDDGLLTSGLDSYTRNANGGRVDVIGSQAQSITWGENDLVTSYTANGLTTNNAFNPLGHRIERVRNGEIAKYVLDINGELSNVLEVRDSSGTMKYRFIHGPSGLTSKFDSTGNLHFYHYDIIGNTVAISDASGNVVDSYAHDPFGAFLNHSGTSDQPFIFLGKYGIEYEGGGHYHIRAREYDANLGRFWSKDKAGVGPGTQGTNPFTYAENNPLSGIDINGLYTLPSKDAFTLEEIPAQYGPYAPPQYTPDLQSIVQNFGKDRNEINDVNNVIQTNPQTCPIHYNSANGTITEHRRTVAEKIESAIYLAGKDPLYRAELFDDYVGPTLLTVLAWEYYAAKTTIAAINNHHIIPKQVYKEFIEALKPLISRDGAANIRKLPNPFHGNHPQYSEYVAKEISRLIGRNNLNRHSLKQLIDRLHKMIDKALGSGRNLNDYFRQFNN